MFDPPQQLITLDAIRKASHRIEGTAVRTPLVPLELPSAAPNAPRILLKLESAQPIGSFKLRGAFNCIAEAAEQDPAALRRGVITYSSGNHAQGVAFAARALGTKAVVVMPSNAPEVKRRATLALDAEVVTVGVASSDRKRKAEELVAEHGYLMIPPYDHPAIIAGQATCGLEILQQAQEQHLTPDLVLSPVSGGGLLSGVATGIKLASEAAGAIVPEVWGAEPELAADARESFLSRTLVEWPAEKTSRTLADGLRTQSLGERNFQHILQFVDGIVAVSEAELRTALKLLLQAGVAAEPSGAVTVAAALFCRHELPAARTIVAIVSGRNIDPALEAELKAEPTALF